MCGIIFTNQSYCNDYLKSTLYRGPDDSKITVLGNWSLGFNRLAFQDTSSSGSQPMHYLNRYYFLFNGEIYNKFELKKSLGDILLKSDSDTEILFLYLIEIINGNLPYDSYDNIDGIFSFVLFDSTNKTLFFSRDRFGVKPLYIINSNEELTLISDFSYFPLDDISRFPNSLGHYLNSPFSFDTSSLYEKINMVQFGVFFSMNLDTLFVEKLFETKLQFQNKTHSLTYLKNNLEESIRRNLIGDYDAVFLLSGGIDSSLLVSLSAKMAPTKNIFTYSVNFLNDHNSERINQELVIDKFKNIENKNVLIDQDYFVNKLSEYIYLTKKLPVIPNEIALFILFEEIKKDGYRLVISGEGADEIFDGYSFVSDAIKVNLIRSLSFFGKLIVKCFNYFGKGLRFNDLLKKPEILFDKILLSDSKLLNEGGYYNIQLIKNSLIEMYLYSLLQRVDTSSMRNNIEVRVPFLSKIIYDNHLKKPSRFFNIFFPAKLSLRIILAKLVNFDIAFSPKKGFAIPWYNWYKTDSTFKKLWIEALKCDFIINVIKDNNIDFTFNPLSEHSTNIFFDKIGFRIISIYLRYKFQK